MIYREELGETGEGRGVIHTLTRSQPEGWEGHRRRIDAGMLEEVGFPPESGPWIYICGPTTFVEVAAGALVDLGHEPIMIRTERFGPTG